MEMLEVREAVETVRTGGDAGAAEALRRELQERLSGLLAAAAERFESAAGPVAVRLEVRRLLNEARYVQGLVRDLSADEEAG